jgi:uroporphyrinogen-III synthase
MTAESRATVAVFRPDDGRLAAAADLLASLGATAVADPMLAIEPTGEVPRDADYVVLTSATGVEIVAGERAADGGPAERWAPGDATLCAVGESTAAALRERGYDVAVVPEEFSSAGLLDALADRVDGAHVELARSDRASQTLPDGLREAGAEVTETTLYRLTRPPGSGDSAARAAAGELDGALFTSSLTVEHFLDAASERGVREAAIAGLADAVVGAIAAGPAETARVAGIAVDVVPERADFEAMACEMVEAIAPTYHE